MKTVQKGFTLIELMIVVAIIAILAAIAIPAYQNYLIRSQVSEGITLMDGAKVAMQEFYANKGYFPPSNVSAGIASADSISGKYVMSVAIGGGGAGSTSGTITSTFNSTAANTAIHGDTVMMTGTVTSGQDNPTWSCYSSTATVNPKYLPAECRQGG